MRKFGLLFIFFATVSGYASVLEDANDALLSKNYSKAIHLYSEACENNNSEGCLKLGQAYYDNSQKFKIKADPLKAFKLFERACDSELADGCNYVGWMYRLGKDIGYNDAKKKEYYEKAVTLYTKSCSNGDIASCSSLAHLYRIGEGVKFDEKKAINLYSLACEKNDMKACTSLGMMYKDSANYIPADFKKSVKYLTLACDNNFANACDNLGFMYQHEPKLKKNAPKAISLYTKACSFGEGCHHLGQIYEELNKINQAKKYYKISCDEGEWAFSCEEYDRLNNGIVRD